jgi:signal transduction histidine kinase
MMSNKNKPLVLVVDDNPQIFQVLGNMLDENGCSPAIAQNGVKALEFVKIKPPDLILLDIMMPDMDGLEVCSKLKQDVATKDIPIIFLTAKLEKKNVIKGLELGAVDYVTKPFNKKELMTRVNTHLKLKATEEQLKKTVDELKQANATKDKFFSIISHDLMNPFNTLMGMASILANDYDFIGADKRKKFINNILQASTTGYNLAENLLSWSRTQTGKIKVTPVILDLGSIVDRNLEFLESQAKKKNIKIFCCFDNTSVFADANLFDTVIRNLLSNAIKFTPENGKIEISASRKNDFVEISISDNGVGIKPDRLDKLFDVGVTQTTMGTSGEKGTGLGLILCKEFVEKNGGSIRVESEDGKGSRFYIHLPSSC